MVFRDWTGRCCQAHAEAQNLDEWRDAHSAACPCRGECGCSMFQPVEDVASIDDRVPLDANVIETGRNHPETSRQAALRAKPLRGELRLRVYGVIAENGTLTDKEGEQITGIDHESYSGCRSTLTKQGWLRDSGERRLSPKSNPVVAWEVAP